MSLDSRYKNTQLILHCNTVIYDVIVNIKLYFASQEW